MPKIVVEGPDGRKFAFPDTMPRAEINAFMKQKYGTKARNETVQDYLARVVREEEATKARAKDIDVKATAAGRAEGERAAERMGVDNPLMMAVAGPAIGLAQQSAARDVYNREGTVLADEAAGLSAINAAGFFVPGMVNREFGARVEEGRRQQPLAAFAGDFAGSVGPGEFIGAGVAKAAQAVGPSMAALGRMFSGQKISPEMQATLQQTAMGSIGGSAYGNFNDVNQDGVIDQKDVYAGAVAGGLGLPAAAKGAQVVNRVSDRVLGSGNPNLKGVDKKRQAYTFDVGGAKAKVTFNESFPDDGDYPRRVPTDLARIREDVRQEYLTPLRAFDRSVEAIVPDRYNREGLGPAGPIRTLQDIVNVEMDISNANLTLPQAKQLFEKTFDTFEDHAIRHKRPVYYFTGAKPSQQTLYENSIKRRGAPKGYVATTGPDGFYFVRDDLFQNFAKELEDGGYDVITRTASSPRTTAEAMPAGGYFGRQSMRPPGSGPSAREIETQQLWATATPIVTQARTTAQSAQQAADAALQSKAPADIARAKDQKKTLVGQIKEAQASRAGMDTPEDARLAETLASLTENTSDPVLLSTQISAAKTSLDRLLTDIGSPVEGNLIPVRTNILTRTQAPRSAADGPQERASVTRYAEGGDEIKPQGFGAGGPKVNPEAVRSAKSEGFDTSRILYRGMREPLGPDGLYATTTPGYETQGLGVSLSTSAKAASEYGGNVYPVVVKGKFFSEKEYVKRINKLYETQGIGSRDAAAKVRAELAAEGYAGLKADGGKLLDKGELRVWGDEGGLIPNVRVLNDAAPPASPPISPMGFGASTPNTPQQAARFETPGSPEYEAAVAKGLDMSQAGRMGRAKKMGFDTDTVLYHGTGGDVRSFTESASGIAGPGVYLARSTDEAGSWAGSRAVRDGGSANVMPLYVRGKIANAAEFRAATQEAESAGNASIFKIQERLQAKGFSGVEFEDGNINIFDPSNIRSVNAAFDPEKSTSSTLLAAAPFAAVGGAGLTSERELGSRMKRDKKD